MNNYSKVYYPIDFDIDTYNLFTPFIDMKGIEIMLGDRVWYKTKGPQKTRYMIVTDMVAKAIRKIKIDPDLGVKEPCIFVSKYIKGMRDDGKVVHLWNYEDADVSLTYRGIKV